MSDKSLEGQNQNSILRKIYSIIPEFCLSHWLLRIPLAVVFVLQGMSKFPVTVEDAESYGLPFFVWWFVSYGELGAGFGLLVGGLMMAKTNLRELGDL